MAFNKLLRRVSTVALLLTVIIQIVSILLMENGFEKFETEEIHEITGYLFFGLTLVHIVVFRNSLKSILTFKNNNNGIR